MPEAYENENFMANLAFPDNLWYNILFSLNNFRKNHNAKRNVRQYVREPKLPFHINIATQ